MWEFDLVGTYQAASNSQSQSVFLFNYDYFDEARQFGQGQVGWFVVRVADPSKAAEVARSIDKLFENSPNETRTATEAEFARQFANQIGNIGLMMGGILGAVFFTIILLTGNTMAQAFRERVPELAVLKTLGFSDALVSLIVLGEAVLLCAVGGGIGLGIAALLAPGVARGIKDILPGFELVWQTIAAGLAIAVLLGLVVGAVPALTARKLRIVDALRER
jgi:putative ABC transport system permease protein